MNLHAIWGIQNQKQFMGFGLTVPQNDVGWANIRPNFFIRILNNFGLLFKYSNNIRIFIFAQKVKKVKKKVKIGSK
jgi:hypothetical protein